MQERSQDFNTLASIILPTGVAQFYLTRYPCFIVYSNLVKVCWKAQIRRVDIQQKSRGKKNQEILASFIFARETISFE